MCLLYTNRWRLSIFWELFILSNQNLQTPNIPYNCQLTAKRQTYIYIHIYIYTTVWKAVIQSIHHGDVLVPLTFRHGFCISQEWVTLKSIGFAANKGISRRPCDFDIFRLRLSEYYKVAEDQEDSQEALLALTKGQERVRRQCFLLQPTHFGKKLCETVDGSEMRRLEWLSLVVNAPSFCRVFIPPGCLTGFLNQQSYMFHVRKAHHLTIHHVCPGRIDIWPMWSTVLTCCPPFGDVFCVNEW